MPLGFVHQDDVRISHHGAHECGPLPHPPRQIGGVVVLVTLQLVGREQLSGAFACFLLAGAAHFQPEDDVLQNRPPWEQEIFCRT